MTEQFVSIVFLILAVTAASFSIFGSLIYEILQMRIKTINARRPHSRALKARPIVTVIFSGEDFDIKSLEQSLLSVSKSSYRKTETIILANDSYPSLKNIIRKLSKKYPSKRIVQVTQDIGGMRVVSEHANGDYILIMRRPYVLEKNAITKMVMHFASNESSKIIVPRTDSIFQFTIRSTLAQYENILRNQLLKAKTLIYGIDINRAEAIVGKKEYLMTESKGTYNEEIGLSIASCEPKERSSIFSIVLFSAIGFISYIIYDSFVHNHSLMLAVFWLGFSGYLVFNIWADSNIGIYKKFNLTLLAPLAFCLFYFASIIYVLKYALASAQPVRHDSRMEFVG